MTAKADKGQDRRERLENELRANLLRRKERTRARASRPEEKEGLPATDGGGRRSPFAAAAEPKERG